MSAPATTLGPAAARPWWPRVLVLLPILLLLIVLRINGQPWWCNCGTYWPYGFPTKSRHNSQHLFDAYSTSHLLHGVIFYFAIRLLLPRLKRGWPLLIATVIEVAWELLENSPIVLKRYRDGTAALGYEGDSVLNSFGDVLSMMLGVVIARRIGWRWSIVLFLVIELAMLWWIRDNLTLNVLMLVHPIEAVKRWQTAA